MPDALGSLPNTVIDTPGLVGYVSVPEHMQTSYGSKGASITAGASVLAPWVIGRRPYFLVPK
jgi:hypothetical protein